MVQSLNVRQNDPRLSGAPLSTSAGSLGYASATRPRPTKSQRPSRTLRRRRQQPLEAPADPLNEDDESSVPSWMVDHSLPGPDVIVEEGERSQLLQQLIEELPEEKQAVFRLVYDAEMETRQVAQTLGIPEAEFLKLGPVGRDNPDCK